MKTFMTFAAVGVSALVASLAPAAAGFYFEGLTPYAGRYCQDVDPTLSDPPITARAIDWETTSADAQSNGGRPPYEAQGCLPEGKGSMSGFVADPIPVPQK